MDRVFIAIYMLAIFSPILWMFWYVLRNWPDTNELTDSYNEQEHTDER